MSVGRRSWGRVFVLGLALVGAPSNAAECGGRRPCRCGDQVVEDYQMSADLGPCSGHGLRLARSVMFDGGGKAIRGTSVPESVGLLIPAAASGSRVQNLEVLGFERGVRLNGASGVEVTHVRAHHNGIEKTATGYGIDLSGGASSNRLDRVTVHDNADEGIHLGRNARGNRITGSEIRDNFRENVYVLAGVENVIDGSVVRGGGAAGIYVKNSKGTTIARTRVEDRPIVIRGASSGTTLVDDAIVGGGLLLQPYDDEKLGAVRPARTVVRGGRIRCESPCVRVEEAVDTTLDGVGLDCSPAVAVATGNVVTLSATDPAVVTCAGGGQLRRVRDVRVRVVDAAGAPLAGARLSDADGGAVGVSGHDGVIVGRVLQEIVSCGGGSPAPDRSVTVAFGSTSIRVPLAALVGDVVLPDGGRSDPKD